LSWGEEDREDEIEEEETIIQERQDEIREGRCKMIIALWEGGADASVLYKNGDTLLHLLCSHRLLGFSLQLKNHQLVTKMLSLFKQHRMINARNNSGDTPMFCVLNFIDTVDYNCSRHQVNELDPNESEVMRTIKFLLENGADLNTVNNYGFSPLLMAVLRHLIGVKDYLVENGASFCIKSRKPLTRLSKRNDAKIDKETETHNIIAEIIADLCFGGESCEYLKIVKSTKLGRFNKDWTETGSITSQWIDPSISDQIGIVSFKVLLKKVKIWLSENQNICDAELIEQAAKKNLKKLKVVEKESCVICCSNEPSVTFFPCGHKALCQDCHQGDQQKSCACCRRKIKFFKLGDKKPKKKDEVVEKLTKMTLRKR